ARAAHASSRAARLRRRAPPRFATPRDPPRPAARATRRAPRARPSVARAARPSHFRFDSSIGVQLEPARRGRALVEREELALRQELRASGRRAQEQDAVMQPLALLMHVPADDRAHVLVLVDDVPEGVRVAPRDAVEPRAAHRQRMMVHRDDHVLARVRAERLAQPVQARVTETARVLAGEERAKTQERPRAAAYLAAELERAAR